jgi:pyruvate/2-oxoglutarate dehydrogenase complex dihydrolipoamide dehydrogenase (E3) component
LTTHGVRPLDEHNQRLLGLVHPSDWRNPEPARLYDFVVIGGGTAGLVAAVGAAGLGARVALVERALLGGDCLNAGCVPSKTLLRSARVVRDARIGGAAGVSTGTRVDFGHVMARVRATRASIAPNDSAGRLKGLGVDVFFGQASFTGRRAITVAGRTLTFRRALIATGGRPSVPPVPGLRDVPYLTNETVFGLTEQPRDLIVLGAGPVGCELAQAFALLGTGVTLIDSAPRVLPHEDPDAAAVVASSLEQDGVRIVAGASVQSAARRGSDIAVSLMGDEASACALLVATGRAPNIEELNLEAAGVRWGSEGIDVDDRLRTSNARVYAAGDVCSRYKFTHAADALARIAIQNALFFGRRRATALVIPWCTYTFPEVAHVGVTADDARARGCEPVTVPLKEIDRAVIDGDAEGFVRIWHVNGMVVAGTIVAPHAGDLIGYLGRVIASRGTLGNLSAAVFPYPTLSEGLRKAGDAYRRGRLTPFVSGWLDRYFRLVRRLG